MKRRILIIIGVVLLAALIGGSIYYFSSSKDDYAYTPSEQRYLNENKNMNVDLYMPSDIASLTLTGKGLFFDFIDYFTDNTKITINPIAYTLDSDYTGDYGIVLTDKLTDDDTTILEDNYAVITKDNNVYSSALDLKDLKIGYLPDDADEIINSLGSDGLVYIKFDNKETMLEAMSAGTIDAFIGLKSIYLNDVLTNKYHFSYQMCDMKRYYALRLKGDEELKKIIIKEYHKFSNTELTKKYYANLLNAYVTALNISEKELSNLNSKIYRYGYTNLGIYDNTSHRVLTGTNYFIIKDFASFANIDMEYASFYHSLSDLEEALKNKKIDFYFDSTSFHSEDDSVTVKPIQTQIVFLTHNSGHLTINSLNSLKDKEILTIKDSKIEKWLLDNKLKVKSFDNYQDLFDKGKLGKKKIIAMELGSYEYYKTRKLNNFHITYIADDVLNYGFVVNKDNKTFMDLFNFYLEYINPNDVIDMGYANAYEYEGLNVFLFIAVIILSLIIIFQFLGRIKKFFKYIFKHKKKALSKDEKLKYIDSLTSLKNRTYLNDNVEKWDDSEIYPQIIIVVDLNNIAYINDSFGREEGDKVITEAANILIQTQMANTEIIRTDGNEFLIYMVEYDEKQAVSYIRKLNREFKNLSHGFGAAIGYSIISDAIKTIDDAINEATLDMRTNKELMNEEEK